MENLKMLSLLRGNASTRVKVLLVYLLFPLFAQAEGEPEHIKVAFLADIHLHSPIDAAANIPEGSLPKDAITQQPLLLRSMRAQLKSTRLFNENILVLKQALDDIVRRNIKLVALPGDFTDDGQPVNILALRNILDSYRETHGVRFFAINGNHDPVRPFTREGGKRDFLNSEGGEISVVSNQHPDCINRNSDYCSDLLKEWGYHEIATTLSNHGFLADKLDLLYETPFGTVDINSRHWRWCDENNHCVDMPDMSYLVEPVEGIWLLAIDANVYAPIGDYEDKRFKGSSNAGYNALVKYKPQLLKWIEEIVKRANQQNKKLVSFSHFPMAEFSDLQTKSITDLLGDKAMQMSRQPSSTTTSVLASTGLKLHFGGHMHLFDISQSSKQGLLNVQVPSLAAYQPGYTVATVGLNGVTSIETIVIKEVKNFSRWFNVYESEWQHRRSSGLDNWDRDSLSAKNYLELTDTHLKTIVQHRYISDWPETIVAALTTHNIQEILALNQCEFNYPNKSTVGQLNADTFIYDFYRARNAGSFADFGNRYGLYQTIAQQADLGGCMSPTSSIAKNKALKQALVLIANMAISSKKDKAVINLML